MMNTQESWHLYEGASHLGAQGGTLRVEAGQVWLTRSGDPDDHFLRAGETIRVPPGDALVEAWEPTGTPARIVWQPRSRLERWRIGLQRACARCWDLVDPVRRVAIGAVAALVALAVFGAVFGPLSDARARTLAEAHAAGPLLHNAGADRRPDGRNAGEQRRRLVAKEARRGTAGAA
jgi:hypothetical protein